MLLQRNRLENPAQRKGILALLIQVVTMAACVAGPSAAPSAQAAPLRWQFPQGFKWCVSTAAHQIEGYNTESDWWDFEQIPGKIKNNERSGAASDHWNRLEEDTALLKDLNVQQYRFSIEWARIEPSPGKWDQQAVEHYRTELALLESNGIEPMITLQHFTLPRWVAAQGGWAWQGMPEAFARFTRKVYTEIAPGTRDWITLNEPVVNILGGYVKGFFPPGLNRGMKALRAPLLGMIRGHAAAYRVLHDEAKRLGRPVRVGVAHHLRVIEPDSPMNPLLNAIAELLDSSANWAFPMALETGRLKISVPGGDPLEINTWIPEAAGTQDFIGVNYYSRDLVGLKLTMPIEPDLIVFERSEVNDLGWEIYPEGFYRILKTTAAKFPGKPILITENGVADAVDSRRPRFIMNHLLQLHRAMSEGVPVEAYCHWAPYDNFEWHNGFSARFGLYHVDYATQKRTPRRSAALYSKIARKNSLER